eukprot:g4666.t1
MSTVKAPPSAVPLVFDRFGTVAAEVFALALGRCSTDLNSETPLAEELLDILRAIDACESQILKSNDHALKTNWRHLAKRKKKRVHFCTFDLTTGSPPEKWQDIRNTDNADSNKTVGGGSGSDSSSKVQIMQEALAYELGSLLEASRAFRGQMISNDGSSCALDAFLRGLNEVSADMTMSLILRKAATFFHSELAYMRDDSRLPFSTQFRSSIMSAIRFHMRCLFNTKPDSITTRPCSESLGELDDAAGGNEENAGKHDAPDGENQIASMTLKIDAEGSIKFCGNDDIAAIIHQALRDRFTTSSNSTEGLSVNFVGGDFSSIDKRWLRLEASRFLYEVLSHPVVENSLHGHGTAQAWAHLSRLGSILSKFPEICHDEQCVVGFATNPRAIIDNLKAELNGDTPRKAQHVRSALLHVDACLYSKTMADYSAAEDAKYKGTRKRSKRKCKKSSSQKKVKVPTDLSPTSKYILSKALRRFEYPTLNQRGEAPLLYGENLNLRSSAAVSSVCMECKKKCERNSAMASCVSCENHFESETTVKMQASKVGIKFSPPTLGVEFKEDPNTGTRPDAVLIDVSELVNSAGSDRALLEAVREKNPDVISADVVSLPQVLRLLGQLRVKAAAGATATPSAPASAAAAPAAPNNTPTQAPVASPPAAANSGTKKGLAASTDGATGKTIISVGTRIKGKRPNWSKPYEGSVTKVNHNKIPVTLNIHFDDGSDEKFFPLKYIVGYKEGLLELEKDPSKSSSGSSSSSTTATASGGSSGSNSEGVIGEGSRVSVKRPNWSKPYDGVVKKVKSRILLHVSFDDGTEDKFIKWAWVVGHENLTIDVGGGTAKAKFTAPDGKGFQKQGEYRKYMMEKFYSFKNLSGRKDLVKAPGSVNGQPFELKDLTDCEAQVLCWSSTVQVDRLKNCRVLIGPVESSCFVRNCEGCEFIMACRQLRTRDLKDCTFRLLAGTDPVIERSTGLTFAPFSGAYHGLRKHCSSAGLDPNDNHWRLIFDFNKGGSDGYGIPDPHFRLDNNKAPDWVNNADKGDCTDLPCENPDPADAVATSQSDGGHGFSGEKKKKNNDPAAAAMAALPTPSGPPKDPFDWVKDADVPAMKSEGNTRVRVCFSREGGPIRASHFYLGKITAVGEKDGKPVFNVKYDDGDTEDNVPMQWVQVRKPQNGVYGSKDGAVENASNPSPAKSVSGSDASMGEYSVSFDEDADGSEDSGF